jgi:hypothetical protein
MEVITRAARDALDRRMSLAIVVVRTSCLPWRRLNLVPQAAPSLLARRGTPLARPPWECRRLGAPRMPPLARTATPSSLALWIGEPPPPRYRFGNRRHYSGSRNCRHRASELGSRGNSTHRPRVRRRTRSRATATVARSWVGAIANESGWGVKNWTLSLRVFFYRRLDLVRLDQIAPFDLVWSFSNY